MGKLSILRVRVATTLAALVILAGTGAALGIPGRSPAAVQDAATIPDTVSCAECQIEVTPLVRLGNDEPPGLVESHYTHAVRDGRGRYYVYNSDSGDELSVFNSDGKFLRVLGQPGQGPGEHQGLTVVRADDDGNILVFDRARRVNVFSPDYELVRTFNVGVQPNPDLVLMPNGAMVVVSDESTPTSIGLPLHRISPEGRRLDSFGPEELRRYIPTEETLRYFFRAMGRAREGGVWSILKTRYLIERWDKEGKRDLVLQREAPWFPPRISGPFESDAPFVFGVQEDHEALLWVLTMVPAENLAEVLERNNRTAPRLNEDYWDTVIEVIDVGAREVVARTKVPEYLHFVDVGVVGGVSDTDLDSYEYIFDIQLNRPREGR